MARRGVAWLLFVLASAAGCGGSSSHGGSAGTAPGGGGSGTTTQTPPAGFQFGTQGPWAVSNTIYGAKDGIQEATVVGLTTDESQNRWLATPSALYLLRPGDSTFKRYDERDGLHMGQNRAHYCNNRPIPVDQACASGESWGVASPDGISVIAGGGKDEVFVGYHGINIGGFDCGANGNGEDWCDPDRHSGKIDRVKLQADGTLQVDRFDLVANAHGGMYWHDRSIRRLVFDHLVHAHTLYAGTEHGVTILFPDRFRLPLPGEWYDAAYQEWMGDHLHARVCLDAPCDATGSNQRMGEWYGLGLDANGDLWHAGKWTAGLITWDQSPLDWWQRHGGAYKVAFGDPYYPDGTGSPPVFRVANEGHMVALTAVTTCPDGKTWFGSSGVSDGVAETVASYDGHTFAYFTAQALGLGEAAVRDLLCLPDGRLVLAGFTTGLALYNPATGAIQHLQAADGSLPNDWITALELDRMPSPPTLHVSTHGGAAALRVLP